MEEIKITGLTASNVAAIKEVWPDGVMGTLPGDDITVTTTGSTATFKRTNGGEVASGNLLAVIQHGMNRYPMRGHPRAFLHAVRRKVVAVFMSK